MDLQSILSHRTNCLICGSEMKLHAPEYPRLVFYVDEKGMKINSSHTKHGIRMFFGFDGKYTRTKQNYKIYREPISITKQCDTCLSGNSHTVEFTNTPRNIRLKGRTPSWSTMSSVRQQLFTSINNMKSKDCAYRFQIMGDAEGNYDGALNYEVVRHYDDDRFWHMDTSFVTGNSILHHGSFNGTLEDIMTLHIPAVMNITNMQNIDQFLSKFKMYMLMS